MLHHTNKRRTVKLNETKSTEARGKLRRVAMELELRQGKKMSKFDSLKPILNLLETMFVKEGLAQHQADLLVLDIAERLVTAGYGWDKILQFQSKVTEYLVFHFHQGVLRTKIMEIFQVFSTFLRGKSNPNVIKHPILVTPTLLNSPIIRQI